MAYVLGYIFADGHVIDTPYNRAKYVCVTSADRDRIEAVKALLRSDHTILKVDKGGNHKIVYQIKIGSHALFNGLAKYGVTTGKSLSLPFPFIPGKYRSHFIRGYFDGDGCASIERNRRGMIRRLQAIFTSGSKKFLQSLEEVLMEETGISSSRLVKHGSSKNAFQLRYSTRDSLRLFLYLYDTNMDTKLYLARKYAIFNEYLANRDLTRDTIPQILTKRGPVVK